MTGVIDRKQLTLDYLVIFHHSSLSNITIFGADQKIIFHQMLFNLNEPFGK
jgi:hypothetical protein